MRSMKICLVLSLSVLGCAAEGAVRPPVSHVPPGSNASITMGDPAPPAPHAGRPLAPIVLQGPFPSLDKACETGKSLVGAPFTDAACSVTPVNLGADAPFQGALLHAKDAKKPIAAASGVFFLAIGRDAGWYFVKKPLDQMSGAAGQTYLPAVTLIAASEADGRAVFHLRDSVSSVCNTCEASEQNKLKPVKTTGLVIACRYDPRTRPMCSEPIEVEDKTAVKLGKDGVMTITPPSGKSETVVF